MLRFEIGDLVVTIGIDDKMVASEEFTEAVGKSLARFMKCNWGVIAEEDVEQNERAVRDGDMMIMGAYDTLEGRIWIITDADHKHTTVLWPDEY